MAIYISGVRGLPEQVQKNKDDIKDLQELTTTQGGDLEGEINNRKALIDNGEANISVINVPDDSNSFVINCVDSNNVSHTLLYDADLNRVYADNKELALKEDLDTEVNTRKALIDNGEANISVINVPDDSNSFVINCKDNNNVSHILMFDADLQKITIDGNEVGGTTQSLYRYDIFLIFTDANASGGTISFTILSNTQLSITSSNVIQFLYTNYNHKQFNCFVEFDGAYYGLFDIEGTTLADAYFNFNNGDNSTDVIDVVIDFVCEETQIL